MNRCPECLKISNIKIIDYNFKNPVSDKAYNIIKTKMTKCFECKSEWMSTKQMRELHKLIEEREQLHRRVL